MDEYDYERKQRREREKSERQQIQAANKQHEVALFPEPRRLNPSEDDDEIASKLGDYSTIKDLIKSQMLNTPVLTGINPPSASAICGGSSCVGIVGTMGAGAPAPPAMPPAPPSLSANHRQLPPPPPHQSQHYRPQQPSNYAKHQGVNKQQPYNGRGGYPHQSMNRSNSGMAPPKGPSSHGGQPLLPPPSQPFAGHMPNGRYNASNVAPADGHKSYPSNNNIHPHNTHNGRYPAHQLPPIAKQALLQKVIPKEVNIKILLNIFLTINKSNLFLFKLSFLLLRCIHVHVYDPRMISSKS